MSIKKHYNDIAFNKSGQPFAIGDEAAAGEEHIIGHPDSTPVLIVAKLGNDLGIRVFGPPSTGVADLLDHIAATYRQAVTVAKSNPQ